MRLLKNDSTVETTRDPLNTHDAHDMQEGHAPVGIADIWQAYKFLKPIIHHTTLAPSRTLSNMTGTEIYLKSEHTHKALRLLRLSMVFHVQS